MNIRKIPAILYKYYSFDQENHWLDTIEKHQIYLPSPNQLNDPFECKFSPIMNGNIPPEWRQNPEISKYLQYFEKKITRKGFCTGFKEEFNNYIERYGFYSLSEEKCNILLFSHYSEKHKGFCIGFDTTFLPFSNAQPVSYQTNFPQVNFCDYNDFNLALKEILTKALLTKSEIWKYEKEWRIVFPEIYEKKLPFDGNAIKEIILGCRINENKEKLLLLDILKKQKQKISIFETGPKNDQYILDLKESNPKKI